MIREPIWRAVWRVNRVVPTALLCLLIGNVAIYLFLAFGLEERVATAQSDYIRLQAEERRNQSGGADSELPLVIYTRGIEDLQKFRQAIPDKQKLSGLVGELFSLADRSGLKIDNVQYVSKKDPQRKLLQYKINYQVTGTYNQLKKMVHMIEQSERLVIIDELSLGSIRKDDRVSLSLTLTTFFRMGLV